MKHSFKTILLLFALICLARSHDETACNHHEHQEKNPPEFLDIEENFISEEPGRLLASKSYPQFRIYANYDNLQRTAPSSYASYIKNELAPPVLAYYEAALKIKYPVSGNLKFSSSVRTLCGMTTPSALKNGVAADFVILFNSRSESSSILATSYNCYLASGSKRPLVAHTNFNRQMLKEAKGNTMTHEKNTYLLFHELMHTLGFSKNLYRYFVDGNGKRLSGHIKSVKVAGSTRTVIDVPSLTRKIREFHGCSTIPGAIMGSGDASHWDKRMYLYETMQSGSVYGKRMSELSLGMLEASGWYAVNYTYAEPYFYGQGQGCSFISGKCSSSKSYFDEYCTGSRRGCGFMGNSGGSCSSGSSMGSCRYVIPSTSYNCENVNAARNARLPSVEAYGSGSGSRCFTGSLSTKRSSSTYSYCFKYNCVGSGSNTKVEILLGSKKAVCSREGTVSVSGYYGSINCPDPLTFCGTVGKKYCPRGCMGRGQCVANKCRCNKGFTGVDCGLKA